MGNERSVIESYGTLGLPALDPQVRARIAEQLALAEVRKANAEASRAEGVVKDQDQNRLERSRYANKLFVMECIFIFLLLLLVGISSYLGLSDAVLIVLITTGLSSIVSIFVFVVRYLFSEL
jgi:antibiotic biosynthesis monooxygenase (ABM) superfamily enzyme